MATKFDQTMMQDIGQLPRLSLGTYLFNMLLVGNSDLESLQCCYGED